MVSDVPTLLSYRSATLALTSPPPPLSVEMDNYCLKRHGGARDSQLELCAVGSVGAAAEPLCLLDINRCAPHESCISDGLFVSDKINTVIKASDA